MTESRPPKNIRTSRLLEGGATLLFGVAVLLFFALAYPHHLHYQEQFQLFLFDSNYMLEVVKLPGGVADLLGRFCTQFFLFAWIGALIISLLFMAIQLLTLRWVGRGWLYALSFVPAALLWLFLLDENALLGGVWAVLLTMLAAWGCDHLPSGWVKQALLLIAVPLLYWMAGPVSVLFILLQIRRPERTAWYWYCGALVLFVLMPVVLAHYLPVPADSLWRGIHYHRFPTEVPTLMWESVLSVIVLCLVSRLLPRLANASCRPIVPTLTSLLVIGCIGLIVKQNYNAKAEKVMAYDFMACHQQWNRILETIRAEKPNNQIGVTVQNLALGMHGTLVEQLLNYHQNGLLGLLPDVQRDATSPLPTAEAFYQLGMIYVAQRTVFEAQEAILDFQKSARCYKRLAQTNLIIGSYEVSRKYLASLQKTLFYRDWANETLSLLGDEEAIAKHPEYGRLRQMAYNENFFFSDHTTPDMLKSLYLSNTDNQLAYQYMLASFVLTGDRDSFLQFTNQNR